MRKLRLKKRSLKGMTLVEIVIALFIFTLMALMMVQIGEVINNLSRNANHVNNKVAIEAPLAENGSKTSGLTNVVNDNLGISVNVGGASANVKAETYSTAGAAAGNQFARTNATIDLEFVDVNLEMKTGDGIWIPPEDEEDEEGESE